MPGEESKLSLEIKLQTKLVGAIEGIFSVPSYQRGYRWSEDEVTRLLEDIYTNGTNNYCLQPIVVRNDDNVFEVIDGQQRLTTLYLIYKYMNTASGGFMEEPKFSLTYTRENSKDYLENIDLSNKEDNIESYFIGSAYKTIATWFEGKEKKSALTNMNKYFDENVKIIWYEVDSSEDAIALFTRLNIGKIPLTSAELVKAIFLSRDNNTQMTREQQEEISLQWDNIEKELHNDSLWYFLSNSSKSSFQTRIDLILNLISGKEKSNRGHYHTFFYFDNLKKTKNLDIIWREIQHTFLILKDWFAKHELYHKIGYLIASETSALQDLFTLSKGKTKKQFRSELDSIICKSIKIKNSYADLSYDKPADYKQISKLLLLFNVESVRQNGDHTQRFPFEKHKTHGNTKTTWSLEHIHAQQAEGLRTEEMWREWLSLHIPSLTALKDDSGLANEIQEMLNKTKIDRQDFEAAQQKTVEILSVQGNTEYLHSIANLALLSTSDNAALNNSTFDVKRNEIIKMDRNGQYIPFCTKMVFLKYYTPSMDNQLHFWGQSDRIAYIQAINTVLKDYLAEEIQIEGVEIQNDNN